MSLNFANYGDIGEISEPTGMPATEGWIHTRPNSGSTPSLALGMIISFLGAIALFLALYFGLTLVSIATTPTSSPPYPFVSTTLPSVGAPAPSVTVTKVAANYTKIISKNLYVVQDSTLRTWSTMTQSWLSTPALDLQSGNNGPTAVVLHPNLQTAYVLNRVSNSITIVAVDRNPQAVLQTLSLTNLGEPRQVAPAAGAITPDGLYLYVSCDGGICQIDLTLNQISTFITDQRINKPGYMIISPSGKDLFVCSGVVSLPQVTKIRIADPNNLVINAQQNTNIVVDASPPSSATSYGMTGVSMALNAAETVLYCVPVSQNNVTYVYAIDLTTPFPHGSKIRKFAEPITQSLTIRAVALSPDESAIFAVADSSVSATNFFVQAVASNVQKVVTTNISPAENEIISDMLVSDKNIYFSAQNFSTNTSSIITRAAVYPYAAVSTDMSTIPGISGLCSRLTLFQRAQ